MSLCSHCNQPQGDYPAVEAIKLEMAVIIKRMEEGRDFGFTPSTIKQSMTDAINNKFKDETNGQLRQRGT